MSYIAIVDYGAGNLMSVHNSLDFLGYENKIADTAEDLERAAGVILPGVGAFPDAMDALYASGLTGAVLEAARKKPFLGICLACRCCSRARMRYAPVPGSACCRDVSRASQPRSSCRKSAGTHSTSCSRTQ